MEKRKKHTYESIKESASKYNTKKEWREGDNKSYTYAYLNGLFNDKSIVGHFNTSRTFHTHETVRTEALLYQSRSQFQDLSKGAYFYARRHNLLDDICSHMKILSRGRGKYSRQELVSEALKYRTRGEFQKKSIGAYHSATNQGILTQICSHMISGYIKHTIESTTSDALKYNSRKEYELGSYGSYQAACKNGWIDEVCSHMKSNFVFWTKELCCVEAKKYDTRSSFEAGSKNAYNGALRYGWMDEICTHMSSVCRSGAYNMVNAEKNMVEWKDKLCEIYLVKFVGDNEYFYKFGIASKGVLSRFNTYYRKSYNVVLLDSIKTNWYDATYIERYNLDRFDQYIPKEKITGYTECFKLPEGMSECDLRIIT